MNISLRLFLLFTLLTGFRFSILAQNDTNAIKQLLDTAFIYERSDYDKSFNAAKKALSLSEKLDYKQGISAAHRQVGLIYNNKGEFDKAISEFVIAIKFAEKNNLITEQARANLHIGLVYLEMNHLKDAMNYFLRGKSICEKHKIDRGLVQFLMNIGIVHDLSKNYDSAFYYFNSTRAFYFKNNNSSGLASVENNIANIFKRQKKFAEARPHYMLALGYSKQTNDMYMATNYANIAEIDAELGNHKSAVKYIDSAITTAKSFGSDKIVYDCLVKKQIALEKQGDYKGSSECYKEILFLKDSILNKDIEKSVIEMQTKYESEKKEAENKLLKQQNELQDLKIEATKKQTVFLFIGLGLTVLMLLVAFYAYRIKIKTNKLLGEQNEQINKQNTTLKMLNFQLIESEEAIQKSDAAKDKLLSVISHDISNPVKALANYTGGLITTSGSLSKEEMLKALNSINSTIVPLQSMLNNLLNWSHIQKNGLRSFIQPLNLNEVIQECLFIYKNTAADKNISFAVFAPKGAIIKADKEMMLIIVRNLINNAIKFSPRNSVVTISFSNNTLGICDKGLGMEHTLITKILNEENTQSNYGTENEKGIGMGLQLVAECVKAQQFTWNIRSEINKGTCFEIRVIPSVIIK